MTTETAPAIDMDALNEVIGQLVSDYNAAMASALVYIGDRNRLFTAMDGAGTVTPNELASRTGQSSRYLLEWLSAMACSGYVEYDPETGRYTLYAGAGGAVSPRRDLALQPCERRLGDRDQA